MTLMNELLPVLQGYLKSSKNLRDCAEWLASVDWDDPELAEHEKKAIGLFWLQTSPKVSETSQNSGIRLPNSWPQVPTSCSQRTGGSNHGI
jgi:hypothetical protein